MGNVYEAIVSLEVGKWLMRIAAKDCVFQG